MRAAWVVLLLLVGCTPREEKLQNLRGRAALQGAMVRHYQEQQDSIIARLARRPPAEIADSVRAVADSLLQAQARLDLLERDIARLLR